MNTNYYFLTSALPDLQIGHPPDLNFNTFQFMLKLNLDPKDMSQVIVMRRYYDIENIRAFWLKEELDNRGYFNLNELEDALISQIGFPSYVYDFLDRHEHLKERLYFFPELLKAYFQNEIEHATGFLKNYLEFEREWRLVSAAFRAKKLKRDIVEELQFEDSSDDLMLEIIAQKDSKNFEPPVHYADLKLIFEKNYTAPLALHLALCQYRFEKIESMYRLEVFSIGRILGFMAQLIIVEKWLELARSQAQMDYFYGVKASAGL